MDSWRKVWREGVAPQLSEHALLCLKTALETDDPRLVQGQTTTPPPLQCVRDWPVEGGCAIGFCGAVENGGLLPEDDPDHPEARSRAPAAEVWKVEEYFAAVCHEADQRLGEPAAVRWFLNWFDETPRDEMRALLLPEVELALAGRAGKEATHAA